MGAEGTKTTQVNEPATILLSTGPKEAGLGGEGDEIPAWRARWELARLLSYTKRYGESLKQYRKLLAEKPGLSEARAEMAKVLYWAGRKTEALKELEQLPGGRASAETKLLKADLMAADKRYPEAINLYRQYLKDKPDDLAARFRLAQVLSWSGKYPLALEEYEAILSQKPDDVQVRRHYAFVLSWAGQFEKAAKELEKTLKD
jgi:tetratricopeptide (TPR) repeat protein